MSKQGFNKTQGSWLQSFQKTEVTKQVVCCMYVPPYRKLHGGTFKHITHVASLTVTEERKTGFMLQNEVKQLIWRTAL